MRFIPFLVLVALTLVASCSTFTSAEDPTQIKSLMTDLQREVPKEDRRHIKGSLRIADSTAAEEERNANVPQAVVAKSNFAETLAKFTRKLWDNAFFKKIRAAMSKAYKKMGEYGAAAFQKLGVISKNAKKSDAGKTLATTEAKADPTSGEVGSKALKTLDTAVAKAESTSGTAGTTTLKNSDAVESLGTVETTALKNSDAVESLGATKTKPDPIVRDAETKANNAIEAKKAVTTEAKVLPTLDATKSQSRITPSDIYQRMNTIMTALLQKSGKFGKGAYDVAKMAAASLVKATGLAFNKANTKWKDSILKIMLDQLKRKEVPVKTLQHSGGINRS